MKHYTFDLIHQLNIYFLVLTFHHYLTIIIGIAQVGLLFAALTFMMNRNSLLRRIKASCLALLYCFISFGFVNRFKLANCSVFTDGIKYYVSDTALLVLIELTKFKLRTLLVCSLNVATWLYGKHLYSIHSKRLHFFLHIARI